MPPKSNQHKPLRMSITTDSAYVEPGKLRSFIEAPAPYLRKLITKYYYLRKTDKEIARLIKSHPTFRSDLWGISDSSVKRQRKKYHLYKARAQRHTLQSISETVDKIRKKFPRRGARTITNELFFSYNMAVPRELVELYLHITEPEEVRTRRKRRLVRRIMWSAGVNDVWSQDQHDKWRRFGLFWHASVEIHSGYINWLRIWWTNRNPRLVTSFYIDRAREIGGIPLLTQSDPGTENNGIANAHTLLRRRLDPTLAGTVQHRFMHIKKNIKPEILWSVFRGDFVPGFEAVLQVGLDQGWFNPDIEVEWFIFRWLAIPWLQSEANNWTDLKNSTPRRANKKKILPHGPPALIIERPDEYDTVDFKVGVTSELLDEMKQQFCPEDNPVFQLVPPVFETRLHHIFYNQLGKAREHIDEDSFWDIYREVLAAFQQLPPDPAVQHALSAASHQNDYEDVPAPDRIPVLPGKAFRDGDIVVGVGGGGADFEYVGGLNTPEIPAAALEPDSDIEDALDDSGGDAAAELDVGLVQPRYIALSSDEEDLGEH